MNPKSQPERREVYLALAGPILWAVGMLFSRALVSIGMGLFFLSACYVFYHSTDRLKHYARSFLFAGPMLLFLLPLAQFFFSSDTAYALTLIRLKLPFLFIPFSFYVFRHIIGQYAIPLLMFYAVLVLLTAIGSAAIFFTQHEQQLNMILQGQHVTVPFNPVRYSLMLALSACLFLLFSLRKTGYLRLLLLIMFLLAVVLLHVLATRSGIVVLYLLLFGFGLFQFRHAANKSILLLLLSALLILPVAAWYTIPSFQARIRYMQYEMELIRNDKVTFGSDVMRRISIIGGWKLFGDRPVTGWGGDLKVAMNQWYAETYPLLEAEARQLPHNQFVWMLACYGLPGGILFTALFFYPLIRLKGWRYPLLAMVTALFFISFLVEPTLEEQIGAAYYLWLWGIVIANTMNEKHA